MKNSPPACMGGIPMEYARGHRYHSIRVYKVDYGNRKLLQGEVPGTPAGKVP